MLLKSVAGVLSPSGERARLSILIFHRVLSQPDPLFPGEPDVRRFDRIVGWIGKWFNVLPLHLALDRLQSGTLVERAVSITFDDGYADNVTNAMPILRRHGASATFFVSSAFLDGGSMWNDHVIEAIRNCRLEQIDLKSHGLGEYALETLDHKRIAIASVLRTIKYLDPGQRLLAVEQVVAATKVEDRANLMMRPQQILELKSAGMQIGAHTCTHPILQMVDDNVAQKEICDGKQALESVLGEPVTLFAYPNGKPNVDYSAKHVAMVKDAGFVAAVSTAPGVAVAASDPYQLPRFTPWDKERIKFGVRMLANLRSDGCLTA